MEPSSAAASAKASARVLGSSVGGKPFGSLTSSAFRVAPGHSASTPHAHSTKTDSNELWIGGRRRRRMLHSVNLSNRERIDIGADGFRHGDIPPSLAP